MKTKFLKQLLLGAAGLMSLVAGQAFAQSATATVNVSATINGVCRFYSGPINITVEHSGGVIDPTSGANATGSGTLDYRCVSGVNPQFDIDASGTFASPKTASVTLTDGTNNLTSSMTVTATGGAGTGMGAGQNKTATVGVTITPANFAAAPASTYTKAVTVAIQAAP
jgi:hypothetical protein